jgi:hypothetical protein
MGRSLVVGKPLTTVIDESAGAPIERIVVRSKNGKPLSFREVRFALGPDANPNMKGFIDKRNERVIGSS